MIDAGSAAAIEKLFTDKGGKAIDYDRLVPNGTASAYVTFDGNKVGRAQATGVLAALKGKTKPVVAELWGCQSDTNAAWFKSGNDDILNPLFKSGKIVEGPAAVRARPGRPTARRTASSRRCWSRRTTRSTE